jgi:alkaline phosphatase D
VARPGKQTRTDWTRRRFAAWLLAATACPRETPVPAAAPATAEGILPAEPVALLEHLAFGSCLKQDLPMPILADVVVARPQLFLFVGDNVYAEGPDETRLRAAYDALAARPEFGQLRAAVPILAVWDDHDYGINDGGAEHPNRDVAQRLMLEFFAEPESSPRWSREGAYDARTFGPEGKRVQVVLLDTRSFRDPLVPIEPGAYHYVPTTDDSATILGEAQWRWLEGELAKPADLRLVVSSIQVIADEHPFESWSRFPAERARLVELLARTPGTIVLSGDRHRAELSRLETGGHPLFDLTSSSLNLPIRGEDPNRYRVGPEVAPANFGRVDIDWERRRVRLSLVLEGGETALEHEIALADLGG